MGVLTVSRIAINRRLSLFPFLLLVFLVYRVFVPKGHYFHKETSNCEGFECYRQCLLSQFSVFPMRKIWFKFHHMLRFCSKAADFPLMIEYPNMDDFKYAVLPVAITKEEECNIVTLGIGHDVTSERKMKLHFPEWCRFIGADPFSEINKYLYENIGGAYHKIAVGATNSIREARVYGEKKYENMEVEHVELSRFLKRHANVRKVVDVLLIDIEGQEFELMPLLKKNGRLERNNITVCQYNVEFHWPTGEQAHQFAEYLVEMIHDARYLPLMSSKYWKVARMFVLNVEEEVCSRRYLLKA